MVWSRVARGRTRTPGADPFPVSAADLDPTAMIIGGLSSRHDLIVQGRFEADVSLHMNNVTIGRSGRVRADIYGARICVEGQVHGDLFGEQQVIVRRTGKVRGNITAPQVIVEDGAEFKGTIDMRTGSSGAGRPVE